MKITQAILFQSTELCKLLKVKRITYVQQECGIGIIAKIIILDICGGVLMYNVSQHQKLIYFSWRIKYTSRRLLLLHLSENKTSPDLHCSPDPRAGQMLYSAALLVSALLVSSALSSEEQNTEINVSKRSFASFKFRPQGMEKQSLTKIKLSKSLFFQKRMKF